MNLNFLRTTQAVDYSPGDELPRSASFNPILQVKVGCLAEIRRRQIIAFLSLLLLICRKFLLGINVRILYIRSLLESNVIVIAVTVLYEVEAITVDEYYHWLMDKLDCIGSCGLSC